MICTCIILLMKRAYRLGRQKTFLPTFWAEEQRDRWFSIFPLDKHYSITYQDSEQSFRQKKIKKLINFIFWQNQAHHLDS